MLLDQIFSKFEPVKWVFVRKNGKLKKVRKVIPSHTLDKTSSKKKSMFPISKERK